MDFSSDDVIVTAGGSEALFFTLNAIADPDDEVLIPEPYYTNSGSFINEASIVPIPIPTDQVNGFHLSKKDVITQLISDKTRAILIKNPGNPTGTVYTRDELEMIK